MTGAKKSAQLTTAEEAVPVGTGRKPVASVTNVDERPGTLPERGRVGGVERRPKFGRVRPKQSQT